MLGAIDSWFTTRVAGISQTEDSVGYAKLLVDPAVEGDMTSAAGSYRTPYGVARTDWRRSGDRFRLTVDVPAGSSAEVRVPASGKPARAPKGARLLRLSGQEAVYEVGSGRWTFRSVMAGGR
ncbi:alpha-L-rhamnosidase C-terminal domain-containing protein [Streptomyces olivaceus]